LTTSAVKTVAVVGASNVRSKFGNKALRAYVDEGYSVIPINPHEREVEGLKAYRSVLDVPGPIDMATVYVQPDVALSLLDEFEQKKIPEIWVNPGAESDELLAEARRRGLNVIAACSIIGIGRRPSEFR
jgi:predicted CoA-binding protein